MLHYRLYHLHLAIRHLAVCHRHIEQEVENLQARGVVDVLRYLPRDAYGVNVFLQEFFEQLQRIASTLLAVVLQEERLDMVHL